MLMTGLAKKMMMSKIGAGNAVKLGETNVYAILGSTKRGPAEFAKMAAVKADSAESSVPMKNVVNMPADSYFQGYMTCVEAGEHFKDAFQDFSLETYNEIIDYLQIDKSLKIENMSAVALQRIKIAVTLSRNSRVYMLDNPFRGMNATAREQMLKVIFSWATTDNTIAIMCNMTDEVEQLVDYSVNHAGDVPVISVKRAKAMNESYA